MSCDWKEYTIDELKSSKKHAIAMGPFGSRIKSENFVSSGVPILKGGNLHSSCINDDKCDYLTPEKANELLSSNAFPLDIVITHRGTIGQVSIIPEESKYPKYVISQSQLKISLNLDLINPYYANYYLRSKAGQSQLLSYAAQVGVPAIAQPSSSIKKIHIPCPPIQQQTKVVSFLLSLDKKIELNNQINQTLEDMAQALFKSWFIDFDPVKAKMRGEQPAGMDSETAALFPDKLVDSELGLIPEGWEVDFLSDVCDIFGGGTPSTKVEKYWNGNIHWTTPKDLSDIKSKILIQTSRKITKSGLENINSELLPENTIIFSCRAPIGYLALTKIPTAINQGFFAFTNCRLTTPIFILYLLEHKTPYLRKIAGGSTFLEITRKSMRKLEVIIPNKKIVEIFSKNVNEYYEKIHTLSKQNDTLINTRDTLLPQLLSGEIYLG